MTDEERKEFIKKLPVQRYVLGDNRVCPLCGGTLNRFLLISNPAQRECEDCGELITVY